MEVDFGSLGDCQVACIRDTTDSPLNYSKRYVEDVAEHGDNGNHDDNVCSI
jgi:hypothetical protein